MRIKSLLICFTFLSLGLGLIGCNKEEEDVIVKTDPPVVVEYTIGQPEESEMYTFECVEKSKKGKEITATLTILNEYNDYRPALTIMTEKEEKVVYKESKTTSSKGIVYTYTFTMPEANITLAVDLSIDDTDYKIGKLPKNEEVYLFECVDTAKKNETVIAQLTMLTGNEKLEPTFAITTTSGKNVDYTTTSEFNQLGHTYSYEFKMPGENVSTSISLNTVRRAISTDIKNVYLWIMNCHDKENPDVTCAEAGWSVGFHFNTELGYEYIDGVPEVTGDESGNVQYTYWNEEGTLNGYSYYPCWTFSMPGEPATIKVHATEKTTYANKDFAGEYKGYQISADDDNMITGASTLDFDFNGNTSYTITSTDVNKLNFRGEYTMNEETKRFTYVEDRIYDPSINGTNISMYSHGIRGQVLESGDIFFIAENLVTNSSSNYRYYFASKEACTYTCAARDSYATYCLLEVTKTSGTKHYFFDSYYGTLKEAQVTFTSGTTIDGDAEALISVDGVVLYKYSHTAGNAPKFLGNDGVKGTYTGPEGDLVLDGFGGATIGGQTGTYTLNSNKTLATVTIGEVEAIYVLNTSAKTYSLFDPNAWTGPSQFYAETTGLVGGVVSNARITVYVGCDAQGNPTPGEGAIKAEIINGTNAWQTFISPNMGGYNYDAQAGTITFTQVLAKNSLDNTSSKNPVTFTVSDDLQTLTSTHEILYQYRSTASSSTSINLKDVKIKAVVAPAE